MNYLRLPFLALLTLLSTCARAQVARLAPQPAAALEKSWEQDHRWQEIQDLDGRFRIVSPGEPSHAIDSVETALGVQAYHTFYLRAPDADRAENVIYALSYVDYPAGSLHHDSTELVKEFFAGTEEEAAAAVGGQAVYAVDKQINRFPARQWRIDYPSRSGTASVRTLAVVAGNRYYELKVFARSDRGVNKWADRFFDYLRIFAPDGEQ